MKNLQSNDEAITTFNNALAPIAVHMGFLNERPSEIK